MCESSISERNSFVRGVEACGSAVGAPTSEEFRIGPRGAILVDSSKLPACDGVVRCTWVERPITTNVLGHESQEERTKFTVYKIMVTGGQRGCRVIFRRYTDFCRLNDKLKALSPDIDLALPPKRRFKDNYDIDFLQERQTGLQVFLRNLTSHKDLLRSEAVRLFLSLVDHPGVFDSLEEIRAVCETLEETNHRLQRELLENQRVVDELKHNLEQKENHISLLLQKAEHLSLSSESFKGSFQVDKRTQTHSEEGTCKGNTHR